MYLNFYKEREHVLEPSVPVVPPLSSNLSLIESGKDAWLLSHGKDCSKQVVRSQKCVQLGAETTGLFTHTFFECLSSWPHKNPAEAALSAWMFLKTMGVDPNRLYVKCPPTDKDMWRRMGWPDNQLSEGQTSIHWLAGTGCDTELWRLSSVSVTDGEVVHYGCCGGLERLTAAVNDMGSNYQTDLFAPLLRTIERQTGAPTYRDDHAALNQTYRLVADHVRTVSVCLGDGMFPDFNQSLRALTKQLVLACNQGLFLPDGIKASETELAWAYDNTKRLLLDLCDVNGEVLGDTYPELTQSKIKTVLEHEVDHFKQQDLGGDNLMPTLQRECPPLAGMIDEKDASLFQDALQVMDDHEGNEIDNRFSI